MTRVGSLDALRGLAIVTMMVANLQAILLAPPHPLPLRAIGSIAAPLFIALSGLMVGLTAGRHSFWYFLVKRGAWVMGVGVFVDLVVWRIYPAMSTEVLYLIGLSMPLAYLGTRLPRWGLAGTAGAILLAPPLLQGWLGYGPFPIEFYLSGERVFPAEGQTSLLNHWLVDGWFPLFPWLGFSLVGALVGREWQKGGLARLRPWLKWGGVTLIAVGIASYLFSPPATFVRWSWTEMFYPPTLQYEAAALGVASLLLWLFLNTDTGAGPLRLPLGFLATLGRASLSLYFGHLFLGYQVLTRVAGGWGLMTWAEYAASFAAVVLVLWGVAGGYQALGERERRWLGWGLRGLVALTIAVFIALVAVGRYPLPTGIPLWAGL